MDSRLTFARMPSWQKGFNQALQGTEMHTIPPSSLDAHTNYEFELPSNTTLLFGALSGFLIKGSFQSKESEAADDNSFVQLTGESGSEVALIPNWFEHLIRDITVYHGSSSIETHDVPKNADPFLNTYIYSHMSKDTKDYLFPEPQNPGRCVGLSEGDWSLTDKNSAWRKYAEAAFGQGEITFRYIPTFLFPFHQQPNPSHAGMLQSVVPLQATGRMAVTLKLKEKRDNIFLKAEGNNKVYRFNIQSIHLVVEEARLNLAFERKFLNRREPLIYQGVSRIGIYENITASLLNYRCKLPNVPFPEGIFICALPKDALGPNFKWSIAADANAQVFRPHNIADVRIKFQNKVMAIRSPMLGDFRNHIMGIKSFQDYLENPPFGILQERQGTTSSFTNLLQGGDSTIYPHLYLNLTPSGKESRIIPVGDDGHILTKQGELEVSMNFREGGATNGVVYLIYIFYTDVSIVFDMKTRQFNALYKMAAGSS